MCPRGAHALSPGDISASWEETEGADGGGDLSCIAGDEPVTAAV